jgi:hypothetical protein
MFVGKIKLVKVYFVTNDKETIIFFVIFGVGAKLKLYFHHYFGLTIIFFIEDKTNHINGHA